MTVGSKQGWKADEGTSDRASERNVGKLVGLVLAEVVG